MTSSGVEVGAFAFTGVNNDPWERPDIQLGTLPALLTADFGLQYKDAFNFNDEMFYGAYGDSIGM